MQGMFGGHFALMASIGFLIFAMIFNFQPGALKSLGFKDSIVNLYRAVACGFTAVAFNCINYDYLDDSDCELGWTRTEAEDVANIGYTKARKLFLAHGVLAFIYALTYGSSSMSQFVSSVHFSSAFRSSPRNLT